MCRAHKNLMAPCSTVQRNIESIYSNVQMLHPIYSPNMLYMCTSNSTVTAHPCPLPVTTGIPIPHVSSEIDLEW